MCKLVDRLTNKSIVYYTITQLAYMTAVYRLLIRSEIDERLEFKKIL